jgi:hypothetical protein
MVWVEVPNRWGPKQIIKTRIVALGYRVDERRRIGLGEIRLVIR